MSITIAYYITYSVLKCFEIYYVDVRNLKGVPLNNCRLDYRFLSKDKGYKERPANVLPL